LKSKVRYPKTKAENLEIIEVEGRVTAVAVEIQMDHPDIVQRVLQDQKAGVVLRVPIAHEAMLHETIIRELTKNLLPQNLPMRPKRTDRPLQKD
jgi:hypothetical protein